MAETSEVEFIGGAPYGSIRGGRLHDWSIEDVDFGGSDRRVLVLVLVKHSEDKNTKAKLSIALDVRDVLKHLAWDITDKAAEVLRG